MILLQCLIFASAPEVAQASSAGQISAWHATKFLHIRRIVAKKAMAIDIIESPKQALNGQSQIQFNLVLAMQSGGLVPCGGGSAQALKVPTKCRCSDCNSLLCGSVTEGHNHSVHDL